MLKILRAILLATSLSTTACQGGGEERDICYLRFEFRDAQGLEFVSEASDFYTTLYNSAAEDGLSPPIATGETIYFQYLCETRDQYTSELPRFARVIESSAREFESVQ